MRGGILCEPASGILSASTEDYERRSDRYFRSTCPIQRSVGPAPSPSSFFLLLVAFRNPSRVAPWIVDECKKKKGKKKTKRISALNASRLSWRSASSALCVRKVQSQRPWGLRSDIQKQRVSVFFSSLFRSFSSYFVILPCGAAARFLIISDIKTL